MDNEEIVENSKIEEILDEESLVEDSKFKEKSSKSEEEKGSFSLPTTGISSAGISSKIFKKKEVLKPKLPLEEQLEDLIVDIPLEEEEDRYSGKRPEEIDGAELHGLKDEEREFAYGEQEKEEFYNSGKEKSNYVPGGNQDSNDGGLVDFYDPRQHASSKSQAWVVGQRSSADLSGVVGKAGRDSHDMLSGEAFRGEGIQEGSMGIKNKKYDSN